jgi:hypothetical protein
MRSFILLAIFICMAVPCSLALPQALPQPTLTCNVGPVNKTYGQTQWLLYSCNDTSTLIAVSAPYNPASPFYFSLSLEGTSYHLRGEGTGSKEASDAAYNDLQALSDSAIRDLIEQTKHVGK